MLTAAVVRTGPPSGRRTFTHWSFSPTAATVPPIRARVRAVLEAWRISLDLSGTLLLAVSELVTNVVRHAASVADRLRVTVTFGGGWLRLDVADGDPSLPHVGPVDLEAEGGRGLAIVGLLVAEAGGEVSVVADRRGKTVRVCLPVV
ncbi:ATP-binding protein [Streptomyces sp. ISL-100]|uniref:ATP-binding protein n=1 Tax=Streptomyces sp. ISL-100 TaxID=2819173 RepID=UPI001BEC4059|nr:ATP-binding protein [Streptomyces sp. ISL-100]MBT2398180.1 ATP-binding protein [Streptomyces sp. ISL-100]